MIDKILNVKYLDLKLQRFKDEFQFMQIHLENRVFILNGTIYFKSPTLVLLFSKNDIALYCMLHLFLYIIILMNYRVMIQC